MCLNRLFNMLTAATSFCNLFEPQEPFIVWKLHMCLLNKRLAEL